MPDAVVVTIDSRGQWHLPVAVVVKTVSAGQKQGADFADTVSVTML
jgi:hypothetical protein